MPDVNLTAFRQLAPNIGLNERVKLDGLQQDGTRGVRSSTDLGTGTSRWLNKKLNVKDEATKAFKAAVRRELGDEQSAQRVFQAGGIKVSRVLTGQRLIDALRQLDIEKNHARDEGGEGPDLLGGLRNVRRDSMSTSESDWLSLSGSSDTGEPKPNGATVPQPVSDQWSQYKAALAGNTRFDMARRFVAIHELVKLPLDQLGDPERQALADLMGKDAEGVVDILQMLIEGNGIQPTPGVMAFLGVVRQALVEAGGDDGRIALVDDWLESGPPQEKPKEPELGERLSGVRDQLKDIKAGLIGETLDTTETLEAYGELGSKLLVAVLETAPRGEQEVLNARSGFHARFTYDPERHDDLVGLLIDPSSSKPRLDLLPDPKTHPKEFEAVMRAAAEAFAKAYGGFENLQARSALLKAGVPPELLEPMRERAAREVESRESVTGLRLHGATKLPRTVDFTSTFARETVLHDLDKPLSFEDTGSTGKKLVPPPLDREVDLSSLPRAKSFEQVLGRKLGDDEIVKPQVNGRTLRFTEPDGSVVALKFMKAKEKTEEPGKLHREHESFVLMQDALGDDYPARARSFGIDGEDHPVVKVSKDDLPPEAREALEKELALKGMTLAEDDGCYYCMSYRVSGKNIDPGDYFAYLEETPDDGEFEEGFRSSMETLGKMAAKGFFDPNLIANSYHDKDSSRPWVWSPDLFIPWKDTAGEEERPLDNAKYSNFRVGGLADPDEFRHISQVLDTEFDKLVGGSGVQNEIERSDTGDKEAKTRLTTGFLVGRMIHESLVVATRRLVLQGAFEPGTSKERQDQLITAFKDGVRQGIEAFAAAFTGQPIEEVREALEANGLDLDKALDGIVAERRALYSFEYTDKLREKDGGYFGQLFGVDPGRIEFAPRSEDEIARDSSIRVMPSRSGVLQSPDPIATLKDTLPPGWVSVVGVDTNGKPVHLDDLGWMVRIDEHAQRVFDHPDGSDGVTVDAPPGNKAGPTVVTVQVDSVEQFKDYMDKLKARTHTMQNTGEWNGGYFFQNEMVTNNVLSSTLVGLRVG